MGRHVNRKFICSLVHEYYYNKQKHHKSCVCCSCKSLGYLLDEMEQWNFYGLNRFYDKWFIIFHKSSKKITLFPVFIYKMSKQITVKYYSESYQKQGKPEKYEPYKASDDAAGCDVFAAETKTILLNSVASISLEMLWAIPSGYYGNFFSRSGLLIEHFITVEAGLIDSDFRGDIKVLLFNHQTEKTFTVRAGDRIAQIVFMEKLDVNFQSVTDKHLLGLTKRGSDGFESTEVSEIKKIKKSEFSKEQFSSDENLQIVLEKNDDDKQTSEELTSLELKITREEGIIICNKKVICREMVNISD